MTKIWGRVVATGINIRNELGLRRRWNDRNHGPYSLFFFKKKISHVALVVWRRWGDRRYDAK